MESLEVHLARVEEKVDAILAQTEKQNGRVHELERDVHQMDICLGQLKIKAGIWGAIGAAIPTAVGVLWFIVKAG